MDYANHYEAIKKNGTGCVEEAPISWVKPALLYLDIIREGEKMQ